MSQVNTVLGPVPVNQLGWTLMHEHLLVRWPGWELDPRHSYQRERDLEVISASLATARDYGVKTVLDPDPAGLGRDVGFMAEVAKRSGVNVIATTGVYKDEMMPAYFKARSFEEIADWMLWEISEGIDRTGIKPGAIKVATGLGQITPSEEKALRAASRAHKKTGLPITTHTDGGILGPEQLDIFEEEGVDLSRVVIGHSDSNADLRYHFEIIRRGAIVGLDRIANIQIIPAEIKNGVAASIIAAGYASQLVLSQDTCGVFYGMNPGPGAYGDFSRIFRHVIPRLREAGVGETSIDTVMGELPRKFFGG